MRSGTSARYGGGRWTVSLDEGSGAYCTTTPPGWGCQLFPSSWFRRARETTERGKQGDRTLNHSARARDSKNAPKENLNQHQHARTTPK